MMHAVVFYNAVVSDSYFETSKVQVLEINKKKFHQKRISDSTLRSLLRLYVSCVNL